MKKYRFPILVGALLFLILIPPFFGTTSDLESKAHFFFSALALIASIYVVHGKGVTFFVGMTLFGITFGIHLIAPWAENFSVDIANFSLKALFLGFVTVTLFRKVASARYDIVDRIWGSIAVYFLIGLAWSRLYMLALLLEPTSILNGSGEPIRTVLETTYFSFSTLTTVGYGDMIPQTSFVRALASVEASIGMLFLAVWIAFLISSGLGQPTPEKKS